MSLLNPPDPSRSISSRHVRTAHSLAERKAFNEYDKKAGVRTAFVSVLQKEFADYGLRFSIGGEISFDVFPEGWDKTYALKRLTDEAVAAGSAEAGNLNQDKVPGWDEVHFFGDKTYEVSCSS